MIRLGKGIILIGLMLVFKANAAVINTHVNQYTTSSARLSFWFNIINTKPTCSLTLNGKSNLTYQLGKMAPGANFELNPIILNVNCQGNDSVDTAITARMISGGTLQSSNDEIKLKIGTAPMSSTSPLFWMLSNDGSKIKYTGLEQDEFCIKENSCYLRPVISIPKKSPLGDINLVLALNIVYPI